MTEYGRLCLAIYELEKAMDNMHELFKEIGVDEKLRDDFTTKCLNIGEAVLETRPMPIEIAYAEALTKVIVETKNQLNEELGNIYNRSELKKQAAEKQRVREFLKRYNL